MKNMKWLVTIIAIAAAVAAAVTVIVIYRDQIAHSFSAVKEKIECKKAACCMSKEEKSDFADI